MLNMIDFCKEISDNFRFFNSIKCTIHQMWEIELLRKSVNKNTHIVNCDISIAQQLSEQDRFKCESLRQDIEYKCQENRMKQMYLVGATLFSQGWQLEKDDRLGKRMIALSLER